MTFTTKKGVQIQMLKTRVISAVIFVPLILAFLCLRGNYLFLFVAFISLIGLHEYFKAMRNVKVATIDLLGYAMAVGYFIFMLLPGAGKYIGILVSFFTMAVMSYEIIAQKHNIVDISVTIFGVLYIPFFFSYIIYLDRLKYGNIILWLPFLTAWFTDTLAYFVGRRFGKTKLCPKVSPNKSVEGAIGGVIGCIVLNTVFGIIINHFGYNLSVVHFIIVGLLCGVTAQLGDLSASFIKRYSGVKDFGTLIPGHGGILDRFDSILFTAPTVYSYFFVISNFVK